MENHVSRLLICDFSNARAYCYGVLQKIRQQLLVVSLFSTFSLSSMSSEFKSISIYGVCFKY